LVGRLSRDIEARTTQAGKTMLVANVAVDGDADGEVTWLKALCFGELAFFDDTDLALDDLAKMAEEGGQ